MVNWKKRFRPYGIIWMPMIVFWAGPLQTFRSTCQARGCSASLIHWCLPPSAHVSFWGKGRGASIWYRQHSFSTCFFSWDFPFADRLIRSVIFFIDIFQLNGDFEQVPGGRKHLACCTEPLLYSSTVATWDIDEGCQKQPLWRALMMPNTRVIPTYP